jgi:gentisate 1,2-dioxygenase
MTQEHPISAAAKAQNLTPLWDIYHDVMSDEPRPSCAAHRWRYDEARALLHRAGQEVSVQEAERRVLLFHNPALDRPFATPTLGCGLQLLRQGEAEGAHRHTPAALRFVLEGSGAYTTTQGERIWMQPGDLITTPSWTWHDHCKVTEGEIIWLDGIDMPLVNHLSLNFTELDPAGRQQDLLVADEASLWRYGSGLVPLTGLPTGGSSPVYSYPFDRTCEALQKLRQEERWDPWVGLKLHYASPATGGHIMPTIAAFMQLLPAGFAAAPYRSTDAAVCCVVDGVGQVDVGGETFSLSKNDVFVVPNWTWHRIVAESDLTIFSFSDRALQQNLALWREEKSIPVPAGQG